MLKPIAENITNPLTILIIEDDDSLNVLIQRTLAKQNISTKDFYTGKDVIDWFKSNKPDNFLLLLDYQLHDMNGEDLIRSLRKYNKEIPFVIITGHGDEKTAVDMMKLGALDYIIKDSNFINLLPAVIQQVTNNLLIEKKFIESQNALKKSEEKYRSIFENILDVYFELTTKGIIVELSPSVKNILKYSKEELINKSLFDDKNNEAKFINTLFEKSSISDYEVELTNKNNHKIPCSITAKLLYSDNAPKLIVGTIRNISERKKAEELIKLNEERYRILTENSSDLISKHNWDRSYIYVSPVSKKLLGYSPSEMIGKSAYKYMHQDDIEQIRKNHILLLENKKTSLIETYRIRKKNGDYIWFETNNQVIYNPSTNLVEEIVCVSRDITERKEREELIKAKEIAEKSNIAKSEFLANMSHEIRNPLNAIIGFTNTLSKTKITKKQLEYLDSILVSSKNLLSIFNDILDYSKIESNNIELTFSEFRLRKMVKNVVENYKDSYTSKNIEFKCKVDKVVPNELYGDEKKIVQILNNLISNSIKFTKEGFISLNVSLASKQEKDLKIKFTVADSGIGVKGKDISLLFESFRQLDISTKKEYQGTGLGLSISKKLTELMNGEISFKSEYKKGSSVSFELPLMLSDKGKKPKNDTDDTSKKAKETKKLKILVAEDDAINQLYLASFLKSKGWAVTTASNGIKVLEEYKKKDFDIILMDGQMPKMDGFEATKKIRSLEKQRKKHIPIIAITGYAIQGDREKFINVGMDDYITKPIDENKLIELIESLTSQQ
ncbi:MAG: response regulator [Bacteroidales bacterium]